MKSIKFSYAILSIYFTCSIGSIFGQPGSFTVSNSTECDISAVAYAYDSGCNSEDCTGSDVGNTGYVTVPANSSVDIASGYSGGGTAWRFIYVTAAGGNSDDGDPTCFTQGSTSIYCPVSTFYYKVSWINCHNASYP